MLLSVLPSLVKEAVGETRRDRLTVKEHWRGVPLALPSGHAMHMGALARRPASFRSRSGWAWPRDRALSARRVFLPWAGGRPVEQTIL